jgi:CubicO group peptidase (beta-lactamase class C family)
MKERPEALGFDPQRLERIPAALAADIEAMRFDGAALVVGRGDGVAYARASGFAERATGRALTLDDVFVTMSVGKQFINVLVLAAVEAGRLALHAPVAEVLPEFRGTGKDAITLAQLLSHTSGIASQIPAIAPEELGNIEKLTEYALRAPLESEPGKRVQYSIVVAHSVLALMLVRTDPAGRGIAQILNEDLFAPLGMTSTSLGARADLLERLCPVVSRYRERTLFSGEELEGMGLLLTIPGIEIPGGGYLSTAGDLHRFATMLRLGGELDGTRILSPAAIDLATRNRTGRKPNSLFDCVLALRGWRPWPAYIGLGFFLRGEAITPGPIGSLASPRSFCGWGTGSACFWVDPERDLSFSFLSTGLMEDSRHIERLSRYSDMVISALVA